jgi:uncharacterized protein (TIGR03435 family)
MRVSMRGGPGTDDPSLFTCENCALPGLITKAFDLQPYQLSGPDWLLSTGTQSTRFMVSAKIPSGTTKEQFRLMLQNLLAERFKMTFHHAPKEMPVFNLIVGKNGPKFKEYVEAPDISGDAPKQAGPMKKDAEGFPVLPPGKGFSMAIMNDRAALRSGGGTMSEFAVSVSNQLHQPVTDATGLNGKFEIAMYWVPGDSPNNPGPTIFQAVQDQLGLKLESKKGTIDVLVVDRIEKTPTEN